MSDAVRLYNKCLGTDFERVLKDKGYAYFKSGYYNLNIIGVRGNNRKRVTNVYDDVLVIIYRSPKGNINKLLYYITTEPGIFYMLNPTNRKGTAILVPDQYRGCWEIGKHQGKYKALVQKKPVKVYRDGNKDNVYDMNPEKIDKGVFGINIHRSSEFIVSSNINKWSAGCQVFKDPNEFKNFMRLCEEQAKRYGNSFTYTLIDESDLV